MLDKDLTPVRNLNFFPDFQDVPNKSSTSKLNNLYFVVVVNVKISDNRCYKFSYLKLCLLLRSTVMVLYNVSTIAYIDGSLAVIV